MPTARTPASNALITESISTLTGGVSQQADAVRQPSQAKEIFNCLLSPTEGLKKRPPSQIVQNLGAVFPTEIRLAPYAITLQEDTPTTLQVTFLDFVVEEAGTRFSVAFTFYRVPPFAFPPPETATYLVQPGDTVDDIALGIENAINNLNSMQGFGTATAQLNGKILVNPNEFGKSFTVVFTRDLPAVPILAASSIFTHVYNRDLNEKYLLCIANGKLALVDLIHRDFPVITITSPANDYIVTQTPGLSLRAITVGDHTFIVNREVVVRTLQTLVDAPVSPEWDDAITYVPGDRVLHFVQWVCLTGNTNDEPPSANWLEEDPPQVLADVSSPTRIPEALVWVRMGDYGKTYTVTLNGTPYSFTTSATDPLEIDSTFIAEKLAHLIFFQEYMAPPVSPEWDEVTTYVAGDRVLHYVQWVCLTGNTNDVPPSANWAIEDPPPILISDSEFRVVRSGSSLMITAKNNSEFTIATSDGLGDQSIRAIKGEVQSIEDLPARGVNGFLVKVVGDESSDQDDYYVQYDDSVSVNGDGVWRESLKGGEATTLDPKTMPHVLRREEDGTFTFAEASWDARRVGDLLHSPLPSFLNYQIDDLMFHKNRLGFVSRQNTVYSQVGQYYNVCRVSVQQLLDEDIIDYAIAATETAPIRHVVPMQTKVTLWSDREQFVQAGEPLFTAKTVYADRVTGFECSHRVKPILVGKDIFFCTDRNSATKLMEFYSTDAGTANDADDVTSVVPSYLRGKPLAVCGGQNANMVFVATLTNTNDLYVYNYLWQGQNLIQGSWSTWRFEDGNILAIAFLENTLYLVIQRGPLVMLEKIDILPADTDNQALDIPSDHVVHLDLRYGSQDFDFFGVSTAYSALTNRTTWTFAASPDIAVPHNPLYPMTVVTKVSPASGLSLELPDIQRPATNTISAFGNWVGVDVWIGLKYTQLLEFSKLIPRDNSALSIDRKAKTDGDTIVRNLKLDYIAGYFTVEVTPYGRVTPAYVYELDALTNTDEGTFEVPIQNPNDQVRIVLKNQSHRPATITGMSWDGMFQRRTGN